MLRYQKINRKATSHQTSTYFGCSVLMYSHTILFHYYLVMGTSVEVNSLLWVWGITIFVTQKLRNSSIHQNPLTVTCHYTCRNFGQSKSIFINLYIFAEKI